MELPQLSEEALQRVREFFSSAEAALLWQRLEAGIMADWVLAETPTEREKKWHELQAVLALQATLRDATANKRLTQRTQEAGRTPVYGTRSQT